MVIGNGSSFKFAEEINSRGFSFERDTEFYLRRACIGLEIAFFLFESE